MWDTQCAGLPDARDVAYPFCQSMRAQFITLIAQNFKREHRERPIKTRGTRLVGRQSVTLDPRSHPVADINSGSTNLPGLYEVARCCVHGPASRPPRRPLERVPLPPRRGVAEDGKEHSLETGAALMWKARPQATKRVLLGIHYDTVYSPAHHPSKCQHVTDSKLLARPGVADAKGGIVVVRAALEALEQFSLAPDCGWTLLLTPDEEVGSPSSADLWTSLAAEHDFGLLFEPAMPSGHSWVRAKARATLRLSSKGARARGPRFFRWDATRLPWPATSLHDWTD